MEETKNCYSCGNKKNLIFACSGGADVGELSDRVAREMAQNNRGKMYCLAGIGGRVSGILKTTSEANSIIAIDGCPMDCTKKCLEEAGFNSYSHIRITDLGYEKGKTSTSAETIQSVIDKSDVFGN